MAKKGGLGKGLGALITGAGDLDETPVSLPIAAIAPAGSQVLNLDPRHIRPNPKQPRMSFSEEGLEELADSIRRDGVQEPVIVRKAGDGYELVSGERRVRASIMADLDTVPAICREVSDADMLKLGLVENIQREDLNAIELAKAFQQLIDEFSWTHEELSAQVGKKRATVTNTLRLLSLPEDVQARVVDGALSMGHARALLALPTAQAQRAACRRIVAQGLSVRQVEQLATPLKPKAEKTPAPKDPHIAQVEDDLRRALGTKVTVRHAAENCGTVEIEYYSLDDLERIIARLQRSG